ncbi:AraC family transcriptional regulator [Microvirga terrae]|uniref:AraC family transcriptional regulator n=1 Tax=Microvirga terrae TaxID=2740529 RepID=UPI003D81457D
MSDTPSGMHIISVSLKPVSIQLSSSDGILFEGTMPLGMVLISGPCERLTAEFKSACDFLHIFVSEEYYNRNSAALRSSARKRVRLSQVVERDRSIDQICRKLIDSARSDDPLCLVRVGQAILMRVMSLRTPQRRVCPLPKWRLRRVEDYIDSHIDRSVRLADLAAASGLSQMHFAAQFRAATGYRPHEYLLKRRIDYAITLMSSTNFSLLEIALSVGFQSQAHFSTVFKRFSGTSPALWRHAHRSRSRTDQKHGRGLISGSNTHPQKF